jgi:CRP/FNR family transcriptional regulator, transcriptional activator FtrB
MAVPSGVETMALSKSDADRVRSIRLFKNIADRSLPILLKSASVRHFSSRSPLFNEGDRANSLYTLLNGSVELFGEHHDRRSTIEVVRAMKPIVLTSIADDLNPMSARTLERSELLLVPLKVIHDLIETDPAFARTIIFELAGNLRDIIEAFKNHRLRTTMERLAEWILRADQDAGGTGHFVLPYGKRVLASHLGMAPENLSRNLASLAALGVVVCGRHVSFTDRAALADLGRVANAASAHAYAPPLAQVSPNWQPALRKRAHSNQEAERPSKKRQPALAPD